jgi:biotin carboxyl carrier protein
MTDPPRRLRVTDVDDGAYIEVDPPRAGVGSSTVGPAPPDGTDPPSPLARVQPLERDPGRLDVPSPRYEVVVGGWRFVLDVEDAHRARLRERARRAAAAHAPAVPQTVTAQIPGRVVSVSVAVGDHVTVGQRLLAVEAMKMENEVRSPRAGTVEQVHVTAGVRVELGDELVRIV